LCPKTRQDVDVYLQIIHAPMTITDFNKATKEIERWERRLNKRDI